MNVEGHTSPPTESRRWIDGVGLLIGLAVVGSYGALASLGVSPYIAPEPDEEAREGVLVGAGYCFVFYGWSVGVAVLCFFTEPRPDRVH